MDFVPAHSSEGCVGFSPNFPYIRLWLGFMLSSPRINDHFFRCQEEIRELIILTVGVPSVNSIQFILR